MSEIAITFFGKGDVVEKISIATFREFYDMNKYLELINNLELKDDDNWIYAQRARENEQITLDSKLRLNFKMINDLDDRAVQRVLKEVDSLFLAKALKSADPTTTEKIFLNMSARAVEMIKEDIEYMGPISMSDSKHAQRTIIDIIRHLEEQGEIVVAKEKTTK